MQEAVYTHQTDHVMDCHAHVIVHQFGEQKYLVDFLVQEKWRVRETKRGFECFLVHLSDSIIVLWPSSFTLISSKYLVCVFSVIGEDGVISESHPLSDSVLSCIPTEVGLWRQQVVYSCLDASQQYLAVGSVQGYVWVVDLQSSRLLREFNVSRLRVKSTITSSEAVVHLGLL